MGGGGKRMEDEREVEDRPQGSVFGEAAAEGEAGALIDFFRAQ